MSEMIQRVAKAILEAENPDARDQYTDMARAAIEAMREPTDAMCEAGYSAGTGDWGGKYDNRRELARGRIEPGWQAMIDAAHLR